MPFCPVRDKKENVKTDASSAKVETWEFYSTVETPSSEELAALVSNHTLGKKVAFLYASFKDTYVAVSYTHLDVYKRQLWNIRRCIVPERQNSPGDNFPPVRR